jgi:hypothetical protein
MITQAATEQAVLLVTIRASRYVRATVAAAQQAFTATTVASVGSLAIIVRLRSHGYPIGHSVRGIPNALNPPSVTNEAAAW